MKATKIFVVDDEPVFFEGLKVVLQNLPGLRLTGTATSGREALDLLKAAAPDVLLTDLRMPEMDGVALTKEVRKRYPSLPLVGLTLFKDEHLVARMMHAGAQGFILKPKMWKHLAPAVRCVLAGGLYLCDQSREMMSHLMGAFTHEELALAHTVELTELDKIVLWHICDHKSNKVIADILGMKQKSVENHRTRLYQKTGASNLVALSKFAIIRGIYPGDPPAWQRGNPAKEEGEPS